MPEESGICYIQYATTLPVEGGFSRRKQEVAAGLT
jgi:hypothetical protein